MYKNFFLKFSVNLISSKKKLTIFCLHLDASKIVTKIAEHFVHGTGSDKNILESFLNEFTTEKNWKYYD